MMSFSVLLLAAALPALVGDGVRDDTAAIQARLDSGIACVYLPPPAKAYLISKPLLLGSNQELRLDRFSVVRLADGSDCPMVENRFYRGGGTNEFIAVTGGVWDMNNLGQSPNPIAAPRKGSPRPTRHDPDCFLGMCLRFNRVRNMQVTGVTIRNPVTYGCAFASASHVTVRDITFDYSTWNPQRINMDGIHLDGHCRHFRIANIRGTCFDDMIALNASDGICSPGEGAIRDIDIDGLSCEYGHSGVRLLSAPHPVTDVTIRNVHGNFYVSAVWLTHWKADRPSGRFDNIVVSDVFAAKCIPPPEADCAWRRGLALVLVEEKEEVGNLVLERICREERTLPAPTFAVLAPSTRIENLVIRDCRMANRLGTPIRFIENKGTIGRIVNENNTFSGEWTNRD